VGLPFSGVGRRDTVDNGLRLLVSYLLVVVDDIAQVVSAAIVCLADAHGVMRQVHIAVIAKDCKREKRYVSRQPCCCCCCCCEQKRLFNQDGWREIGNWNDIYLKKQRSCAYISACCLASRNLRQFNEWMDKVV